MRDSMIRQIIRSRQQELVGLATDLIRIPTESTSPKFTKQSAEIGRFISQYLAAKGFQTTGYRNNETELITVVGDASLSNAPGPRLLFCGHSDVVPIGDLSKWSFDPFSGDVRDGVILGRGASDMKAGLAALIFVAGILREFAPTFNLAGSLGVFTSPDEENGGFEVSSLLDQGLITGDACLIGEPTPARHPYVGEKAMAWMRVTVRGALGHGSYHPVLGVSAIRKGAAAVLELEKLWKLQATPPEELEQLLYNTELYYSQLGEENSMLPQLLYRPSYNPGTIQGGIKVNVIAEKCVIEVDTRVPFGMEPRFVQNVARNLVETVAPGSVVEPMGVYNIPNWTLQNRPIVQSVELGIREVLGTEEPTYSILLAGSSDASHFRRHGIDTIIYGPGVQHSIHDYDEYVAIDNLVKCAEVYAEAAIRYLQSNKALS